MVEHYTTAINWLLNNQSIFRSSYELYTAATGSWWILALYIMTIFLIYMVSKSNGAVAAFGLLGVAVLGVYMEAQVLHIVYAIIVLGLAMLIYKSYSTRE